MSDDRKIELWMAKQWEGSFTWMVYDVDAMDCHWFENEDAARSFLKALRDGTRCRREYVGVEGAS